MTEHRYDTTVVWTGNLGRGTTSYAAYERTFEVRASGKAAIAGSSDPAFRGDAARWNPEQMLVAALSACHKLWYLHLCSQEGVVVLGYVDRARGVMVEDADGSGQFTHIVLSPEVTIAASCDLERAQALHGDASRMCFVERTLKCRVIHEPSVAVAEPA